MSPTIPIYCIGESNNTKYWIAEVRKYQCCTIHCWVVLYVQTDCGKWNSGWNGTTYCVGLSDNTKILYCGFKKLQSIVLVVMSIAIHSLLKSLLQLLPRVAQIDSAKSCSSSWWTFVVEVKWLLQLNAIKHDRFDALHWFIVYCRGSKKDFAGITRFPPGRRWRWACWCLCSTTSSTAATQKRELLSIYTLRCFASGSVVGAVDNGCIRAQRINRFKTHSCSHNVALSCYGCDGILNPTWGWPRRSPSKSNFGTHVKRLAAAIHLEFQICFQKFPLKEACCSPLSSLYSMRTWWHLRFWNFMCM